MMIDVHIADGRTVFRFRNRSQFIDLLGRDLGQLGSNRAVDAWVRWHPEEDFVPSRIVSIRKHSVSFTREVTGEERQEFEAKFPSSEPAIRK